MSILTKEKGASKVKSNQGSSLKLSTKVAHIKSHGPTGKKIAATRKELLSHSHLEATMNKEKDTISTKVDEWKESIIDFQSDNVRHEIVEGKSFLGDEKHGLILRNLIEQGKSLLSTVEKSSVKEKSHPRTGELLSDIITSETWVLERELRYVQRPSGSESSDAFKLLASILPHAEPS